MNEFQNFLTDPFVEAVINLALLVHMAIALTIISGILWKVFPYIKKISQNSDTVRGFADTQLGIKTHTEPIAIPRCGMVNRHHIHTKECFT